jgi:hypothetical protein
MSLSMLCLYMDYYSRRQAWRQAQRFLLPTFPLYYSQPSGFCGSNADPPAAIRIERAVAYRLKSLHRTGSHAVRRGCDFKAGDLGDKRTAASRAEGAW